MRRAHLAVGVAAILAFLITGQIMRHRTPPMTTLDAATRLLYRSRHIYVLASGLINAMIGIYWRRSAGWRGGVQAAGSVLLLAAPAALLGAFACEPAAGFRAGELWWSSLGLYALFGGAMMHLVSAGGAFARQ